MTRRDTLLIHHGAGDKRVQLALGHSTPLITLNTFAGEWPDTDDHARAIVDSALGSVPWPTHHQIKTLVKDPQSALLQR